MSANYAKDVIGYGTRVGYVYTHIRVARTDHGFILVYPLCGRGIRPQAYVGQENYVREWHVRYASLDEVVAALPFVAPTYIPCPRCLAKAKKADS